MQQHPEPHVRSAVRVLAMVGELHRRGYQKIRVMPFMSPILEPLQHPLDSGRVARRQARSPSRVDAVGPRVEIGGETAPAVLTRLRGRPCLAPSFSLQRSG
jgi:hypothetical protein